MGVESGWIDDVPGLAGLERAARARLAALAPVDLPADRVVFRPGDPCPAFLILLAGGVRAQILAENGREIVLYRVAPGQTCLLTTAAALAAQPYGAEGVTEAPSRAVPVPLTVFHDLIGDSAVFRRFVFASYGTRLSDLMALVEEVAFGRLDVRLARLLGERAVDGVVTATHHALAVELGSAREVVSRQLKAFERRGWVALSRGRVVLQNPGALAALAALGG